MSVRNAPLLLVIAVGLAAFSVPRPALAAPAAPLPVGHDHHVQVYKLESVEVTGSTRMTSEQVVLELGLMRGTPLDDSFVMTTRTRLLGLGLFKSAILIMRKGSKPGYARLIIDCEDDEDVLGDWAVGGGLAATLTDSSIPSADPNTAPMDYRLTLIARNLFGALHRGSLMLDMDSTGAIREGQAAYGLPRFTREDAQFDAQLFIVNPYYRYLDAMAFGGRGEGLWSHTLAGLGELQYGAAMYVNKEPNFAVTGFPEVVAGPKLAFYRETRLLGFFPGSGEAYGASLLLSPVDTAHSVVEVNAAETWNWNSLLFTTLEVHALAVGTQGFAGRAEARADLALHKSRPDEDQAALFVRLRGGRDVNSAVTLEGEEAILGLRYHSSGFIAEFAVKITRSPQQLAPPTLSGLPGGAL